jgi:hypothetical protein
VPKIVEAIFQQGYKDKKNKLEMAKILELFIVKNWLLYCNFVEN